MTVPALENGPWTFNVNNDVSEATVDDTRKHALWKLKECLKGFAAWSVVASSDSVSVKNIGDATPDLWSAWSNVIGNTEGSAHSWIILENSVVGDQLCIDVAHTAHYVDWVYSATGAFNADGSTTNRPTDSESQVLDVDNQFINSTSDGAIVHTMISNDNKCTRFYIHARSGSDNGGCFICMDELVNTPSVWTGTNKRVINMAFDVVLSSVNTSKTPTAILFAFLTSNWRVYLADATPYEGWNSCNLSTECWGSLYNNDGQPFYKKNDYLTWLGGYPISPVGIFRESATRGGGLGKIQDLYLAHEYHDTYDTYDSVGSREWVKFGCFLVPWNGTQPLEVP